MPTTLSALMSELGQAFTSASSSYYYPALVLSMTQPVVDPLSVGAVIFGDLATIESTLPATLCAALGGGGGTSAPMTLSNVVVSGLANGIVGTPVVDGETVTIAVQFGSATTPTGLTLAKPSITGSFSITPSCSRTAPGIEGTFVTVLSGCSATLSMTVDSTFTASACSIQFSATATTTTFNVSSPLGAAAAIGSALNTAFTDTAAANQAIVALIQSIAQSACNSVANAMTLMLQSADSPPLFSFLLSTLYRVAIDPTNSYYMPDVIANASNPTLEPYDTSGTWGLPDADALDPSSAYTICSSAGAAQNQTWINTPGQACPITLGNIVINGLSNVLPLPPLATSLDNGDIMVTGIAVFGQVAGWPHTFSLTGDFTIAPSCCVTENFRTCSSAAFVEQGIGNFTLTIQSAGIAAAFVISSSNSDSLTATAQKLWFQVDPNQVNPKNIQTTVNITSITDETERDQWNAQAEKALNTPEACLSMVAQLQSEANQASLLNQLSTILTNALNSISG